MHHHAYLYSIVSAITIVTINTMVTFAKMNQISVIKQLTFVMLFPHNHHHTPSLIMELSHAEK